MDNPPWLTYLRPLVGLSSLGCWGIEVPALERSQKSEYFSVNLLMIGCLMSGATENKGEDPVAWSQGENV